MLERGYFEWLPGVRPGDEVLVVQHERDGKPYPLITTARARVERVTASHVVAGGRRFRLQHTRDYQPPGVATDGSRVHQVGTEGYWLRQARWHAALRELQEVLPGAFTELRARMDRFPHGEPLPEGVVGRLEGVVRDARAVREAYRSVGLELEAAADAFWVRVSTP